MGSKPKKQPKDDDELFPDAPVGAKPAKKPKTERRDRPDKADKPAKSEKAEKPQKARDPEPEPKREEPVARVEAPEKAPKPAPAKSDASAGGSVGKKIVLAAVALLAVGGVAVFAFTQLETAPDTRVHPVVVPIKPAGPSSPPPLAVKPITPVPIANKPLLQTPGSKLAPVPNHAAATLPKAPAKGKHSLKELAERSTNHAAIARTLETYDAVRKMVLPSDDRLFQDFKAKQKREAELIDQIRALGPAAIAAMADMIKDLDDQGYAMLLAKTVAGMKDPEALKATADLLATDHDLALQTMLTKSLPDGPDSNALLATAFGSETNPNSRAMLLREYAHRVGDPDMTNPNGNQGQPLDDSARQLFRQAAMSDPDPSVRAEAVQIIGRRGDPQDADLLAQIAMTETNLQIRQSAIVSYALTAQDQSIGTLSTLATSQDNQVEIRASAVLALARVGGSSPTGRDQALAALDQIAQNDPSDAIRSRASSFANSIRNNAAQPQRPIVNQPIPFAPNPRGGR